MLSVLALFGDVRNLYLLENVTVFDTSRAIKIS